MGNLINVNVHAEITVGGCNGRKQEPTTTRTADGKVQFENENYRITAGDDNEVVIHNKNTGETYRVWGDPHVEVDGRQAFDFWGDTTFVLDDGTKVTIGTTPWEAGGNGATLASTVTITDGAYTTQITGVDTNTHGDLSFQEYRGFDSLLADLGTSDGNRIYENGYGSGFYGLAADGSIRNVDQAFINASDEIKNGGPQFFNQFADIFDFFTGLQSIVFNGSLGPRDPGEGTGQRWQVSITVTRNGGQD